MCLLLCHLRSFVITLSPPEWSKKKLPTLKILDFIIYARSLLHGTAASFQVPDWTETISGKECSTVPFTTDKCFVRSTWWWCQNSRLNSPGFKAHGLNRCLWSLLPSLEEMIKSYSMHHEKCPATCKIITAPIDYNHDSANNTKIHFPDFHVLLCIKHAAYSPFISSKDEYHLPC